jgi:hypothetical protein
MPGEEQRPLTVCDSFELPLKGGLVVVFVHQVPQSAHASVVSNRDDESDAHAGLDGRPGDEEGIGLALGHRVQRLLLDVSGFAGLGALVAGDLVSREQDTVGGHHLALFDPHDVANQERMHRRRCVLTVSDDQHVPLLSRRHQLLELQLLGVVVPRPHHHTQHYRYQDAHSLQELVFLPFSWSPLTRSVSLTAASTSRQMPMPKDTMQEMMRIRRVVSSNCSQMSSHKVLILTGRGWLVP